MRVERVGSSRGDVLRLFEGGSVAALDEGELLDRFATRGDPAAFEGLVARLGPMVLGVCRRMLSDPHDVDDAFQATFLILVRKAGAIRDRDLVAPWLYGVALRVARRARVDASRRATREKASSVPEAVEGVSSGWLELRALIDEEIGRLPESHRRLVVLCDVEGLTREEAALRLGWTLNMVRGRLERARVRLRDRLTRRGVAPSGAWAALLVSPSNPSPALVAGTIHAALTFSIGRLGTGLASASAVALSQGVLRMMMLSKLKVGLAVLLSAGFVAGGSGLIASQGPRDKPGAEVVVPPAQIGAKPAGKVDLPRPRSLVDLALQRYREEAALYDQGQIGVDRMVNASEVLMRTERVAAETKPARVAAVRAHRDQLRELLGREEARLKGEPPTAEVAGLKAALMDAELALTRESETPETVATGPFQPRPAGDLARARVEAALQRYETQLTFYHEGRITTDRVMNASKGLMQAERDANDAKSAKVAAVRAHFDRLKEFLKQEQAELEVGRATDADVAEIKTGLLDTEFAMAKELETPEVGSSGVEIPRTFPSKEAIPATTQSLADLAKARVQAASRRLEALKILHEQGQCTIDRYLEASRILMTAERDTADSKTKRFAALKDHVDRLKQIRLRTEIDHGKGRATAADLAEVEQSLEVAKMELARQPDPADPAAAATRARLLRAARERWEAQRSFYEQGRITIDRVLDASRQLMNAEGSIPDSNEERLTAIRLHIIRLRQFQAHAENELKQKGRASIVDVLEIQSELADAEYLLGERALNPSSGGRGHGLP